MIKVKSKKWWWFHRIFRTKTYHACKVAEWRMSQKDVQDEVKNRCLNFILYGVDEVVPEQSGRFYSTGLVEQIQQINERS